jgi:hypothetical protein
MRIYRSRVLFASSAKFNIIGILGLKLKHLDTRLVLPFVLSRSRLIREELSIFSTLPKKAHNHPRFWAGIDQSLSR